uniref:Uncharacterized protein n=1 Tax=Anguilla anguilla TaxID=7936 RepID=A0A0E9RFC6_ANGAN
MLQILETHPEARRRGNNDTSAVSETSAAAAFRSQRGSQNSRKLTANCETPRKVPLPSPGTRAGMSEMRNVFFYIYYV